jgi:hypothetical protein
MSALKYYSSNYNRLINNPEFITKIINNIKTRLGRQLISTEKMYLIQLLKNVNPTAFTKKSPEEISTLIENKVIAEISNQKCDDESVNIHELLKTEIGITNANGTVNTNDKINITNVLGLDNLPDLAKVLNRHIYYWIQDIEL